MQRWVLLMWHWAHPDNMQCRVQSHNAALGASDVPLGAWQDWPGIAGKRLAPHCRPLSLHRGVLTIGASHPQWRQALQYNKPQLLSALKQAGHAIKDLRVQQHYPPASVTVEDEASIWSRHPSRADVHGMGSCPDCGRPAPNGEMKLWGHCGFCHRQDLSRL